MMRRVYMDANATTPLLPEVLEAMRPYFVERFGNASSVHSFGQQARGAVEQARVKMAALLHCRPAEIVFTSGGTESDNLALFGASKPGDHVITTTIEHHAVLHAAEQLAKSGREVTFIPVDDNGVVDLEEVRRALRPNTRLISVMMANNETGAIQPVEAIGAIDEASRGDHLVVLDGFLTQVAALIALRIDPTLDRGRLVASHRSAERAGVLVLGALGLDPLLDLGLRLGEGSGALLALPLVRAACRIVADTRTFEESNLVRPTW